MKIIRVFPKRTSYTPTDDMAFVGRPGLIRPEAHEVHVSCTFSWDKPVAEQLARDWAQYYPKVNVGGPAYDDAGGEFTPGLYVKCPVTITSRGCPRRCPWCYVPHREGKLRELTIQPGSRVQDNNLLACTRSHIEAVFDMLREQPMAASFPGGWDIDYLAPWHVQLLDTITWAALWVAFDGPSCMKKLPKARDLLGQFSQEKLFAYVLMGYDGDTLKEAESRCNQVYEAGFLPFAMLFDGQRDPQWKNLQRKWARPNIYRSTTEVHEQGVLF